jgi:D-lactate dehydrogenase (cytochrome)
MTLQRSDLNTLRGLLPGRLLLTRPGELITYEIDAGLDRGHPDAVIFPESPADVIQIVRWAGARGLPLIARGAGTGVSGGAIAEHGGLILEFARMQRVLSCDTVLRQAVVEPGVVNQALDAFARERGLYYPPDPASGKSATIGGNLAENAGGPHCFKYGVTTNYVLGMDIVLASGHPIRLGGRGVDYPEYDLAGLLTGSEGTLALITAATLRLIRNPPGVKTMMAAFDSLEDAGAAVSAAIARGLMPSTLEMMDQKMMRIIEAYAHPGLPVDAAAALIIEVDGWPESLDGQIEELEQVLRDHGAGSLSVAKTAAEREQIWHGRKSVAGAIARLAPAYYSIDITVPRSKLAPTLSAISAVCEEAELRLGYVLHAGDGNLHPDILVDAPGDAAFMARVHEAGRRMVEISVAQGGSITGEHGVGTEKRMHMPLMFTSDELAAMQEIKEVFDPHGLLNPGKIFPSISEPHCGTATRAVTPPEVAEPASVRLGLGEAGVLAPASTAEAAAMLQACFGGSAPRALRIRGSGSKSALLPPVGVCLSSERLCDILAYQPDDLYVTVGAGMPLNELQARLARDARWVPLVSPWPAATLGGIVATNFNAPLRMRYGYGALRDLVLAATVILPDGRVIRAGRPLVKNVAGYDMVKLFVGSFGTLGLIADVSLKVLSLPRARTTLAMPFATAPEALAVAAELLSGCIVASALLLCSSTIVPGIDADYALLYTAEGLDGEVAAEIAHVERLLRAARTAPSASREFPSGSDIWARWLGSASREETVLRLGINMRDLPGILPRQMPFVADLAAGLLYVRSGKTPSDALGALQSAARAAGGYAVVLQAPELATLPWDYQPESLDLMRAIKARWDPHGLCNPGAFLV